MDKNTLIDLSSEIAMAIATILSKYSRKNAEPEARDTGGVVTTTGIRINYAITV